DPRRRRAGAAREPVRRADRARLSHALAGRAARHGHRPHPAGRRERAQLRPRQGALHRAGEGGLTGAQSRAPDVRGDAKRRAHAAQARLHARDRRRGKTGAGRRDALHADREAVMSTELRDQAVENTLAANPLVGVRAADIAGAARVLLGHMARSPLVATRQYLKLLGEVGRIATGRSELAPPAGDKRFADPAWKESAAYRAVAQCYLAWGGALNGFIDEADMPARDAERARFIVSLLVDAAAPTNTLPGNPAAVKKMLDTGGASLLRGLENFAGDMARHGGLPAQVDARQFAVGKNLATTPGEVVHRTPVMELLRYRPMTDTVHERPLLIAPPQINKYYIFDLVAEKSLVQL